MEIEQDIPMNSSGEQTLSFHHPGNHLLDSNLGPFQVTARHNEANANVSTGQF